LLFDSGTLDELDLQRLYSITGAYYQKLLNCFQESNEGTNRDSFSAHVTIGGVKGLYTIFEAILMRGDEDQLWVAYIDEDVVRYFKTERKFSTVLPKTIEIWRERFPEKPTIFDNDVDRIPSCPK
jgi:hypothetical protein